MEKQKIINILQHTDLFNALTSKNLADMIDVSKQITLENEDILFECDSIEETMYVILQGEIQIYRDELLLSRLSSPEYLGELALIDPNPRSASAKALGKTLLLQISQKDFCSFLVNDHEAVIALMRMLSVRIRASTNQLSNSYQNINHLVHDMKNKLSALGFADILSQNITDDKQIRYLNIITQTKNELDDMMKTALLSARGISTVYKKKNTSLLELINECLKQELMLSPSLEGINVKLSCQEDIHDININPIDIKRVLVNFIVNAAQASQPGQDLNIDISQNAEQTFVTIKDQGCGIADKNLPFIFNEHFTSKPDGNGFGLPACKNIIEKNHQGKIIITSVENTGTTVSFILPS
jgi:signal transduction histidine kinase